MPNETLNSILALDVGTDKSGYCWIDVETYKPCGVGKIENAQIFDCIHQTSKHDVVVFERFAPYNSTGIELITALVWYGKFVRECETLEIPYAEIFRRDVKRHLLGRMKKENGSPDTQVRHALADRFAPGEKNFGKGTKNNPGWFYGFSGTDMIAAYAVGVTYIDSLKGIKDEKRKD